LAQARNCNKPARSLQLAACSVQIAHAFFTRGLRAIHRSRYTIAMIRRLLCLAVFISSVAFSAFAQHPKSLFYMTRDPNSVRSFLDHPDKVDILVPAWYLVDAEGLVSGGPNPLVLDTARQHHVPVTPIVTGAGFVQADVHKLLINPAAYREMFSELISACKQNGYTGFQFDFENVNWADRDLLSTMVQEAANAFHAQNLQISIATVPNSPGSAGETGFDAWLFENWQGAYDLKALAQSADFICLMTYDEHTRYTPPGPVAGWQWTVRNLDYALQFVPANKLFIGIPLYGTHWFAGTPTITPPVPGAPVAPVEKPNPTSQPISTPDALDLARAYGGHLEWDPEDRVSWFYIYRDGMREWVFFTDTRTFRERYELAKQRGVAGFCSWVLGAEDPGIWDVLPSRK
jgi:spore germination protein YaaH